MNVFIGVLSEAYNTAVERIEQIKWEERSRVVLEFLVREKAAKYLPSLYLPVHFRAWRRNGYPCPCRSRKNLVHSISGTSFFDDDPDHHNYLWYCARVPETEEPSNQTLADNMSALDKKLAARMSSFEQKIASQMNSIDEKL